MQIFKTKWFERWAHSEGLGDEALCMAVREINDGLIDAELGGHVVKKRVGLSNRGKRGGVRVLITFRRGDKAFFIYGFAKNERDNITDRELRALKLLAGELLNYTDAAVTRAVAAGELIEVLCHG